MSTPILATKLYIPPPRPNMVARARLTARLEDGLSRTSGVILISAPAGFGKTTLLSEWIAACGRPAGWLSLDAGDKDPVRFLSHLVAALRTLPLQTSAGNAGREEASNARIGEGTLISLEAPQPPSTKAILTSLLNEIASVSEDFILVLDDYHVVDSEPIDEALTFIVEGLPPQMHLVIATREDPDLPLARLRARNQLTELRVKDLRFTDSEAAGFLAQTMGLQLSTEDVTALETRTEGWIAGLQLAGLSMQGTGNTADFIKSFTGSHHFVMDYLVEEVLQQQPESIQSFLLRTSILDRLCAPLCDAVLPGRSDSGQETLEYLERTNLLVVPLDDHREWYRYHHLFADVLQARLMKERPADVAELHLRASVWYEQNDFRTDAIRHALAAGAFERAADLIEMERSAKSGDYFRSATWLGWVQALPDELVRSRPRLSHGYAWELLFLGELGAAEERLDDTERALESTEGLDWLHTSLAIARAFLSQALGRVSDTEAHARRALGLASEKDHLTHGLAGALLGLARMTQGELEPAHQFMAQGMSSLRTAGNLLYATSGTFVLAEIRIIQGRLSDAIRTYDEALQRVTVSGQPALQGSADLHLGLSELYREQGNLEAASEHMRRSEELGLPAGLEDWPYRLHLVRARLREDEGDLDGSLELLDAAERLHSQGPVPDLRPIEALKARVWIRQGRLAETFTWVKQRELSAGDNPSFLREFEHVTLARALLARYRSEGTQGDIQDALELLERLLMAAEEGGRIGSVIEMLVVQSLAHEAQKDISSALMSLERALTVAEPEGYVRIFLDEGAPMADLLGRMNSARAGISPGLTGYIQSLLGAFERQAEMRAGDGGRNTSTSRQPLIEPLSQRELEVLKLIADGLSNQEIAERLFLALDTVKGHNRKIFDKLQVQRRTEAVARARELGIL